MKVNLKSRGLSKSAILRETGLDHRTISKYLDKIFDPVHASYGINKGRILSAFYKDVANLLKQGVMASKIDEIIREKGYSSTIRHHASE